MDEKKIISPEGIEVGMDEEIVNATIIELTDNRGEDDE